MRCLTALTALGLFACGGVDDVASPQPEARPVPNYDDSKADNYVSTNAREFELTGKAHFELPADFADLDNEAKVARLDALAARRLSTVAYAVRRHLAGVVRAANGGISGEDARYFTYFKRRNADHEAAEIVSEKEARFTFRVELVGSYILMSKVSPDTQGRRRTFTLDIAGEAGPTEVEIKGSASRDAFPKYDELFADGVYDIAIHFGGDYNEERFDLDTARWTVESMLEGGWENESVTSFEALKIDSPPFTRKLVVNGETVEARVTVFHSDLVEPDEEHLLTERMKESFATADVVLYSGHAGEGAGFILDYQPRHEIRAAGFATLPMAEKYQIFVLDGCRTYRSYVDDLMANPAKTFENTDIVTTVNTTPFAVGYQTIHELLYWLTITDNDGNHFPVSWKAILRGLNTAAYDDVHYGVHGIDEDPRLNPHGSQGIACQPCTADAECGAGGNLCLGYGSGAACGVACTADTACGDGFRCARLFDDPDLFYLPKQCVRRDYTCQ